MKKKYVTPNFKTIEINNKDAILTVGSSEIDEVGSKDDYGTEEDLANKNPHQWSSIWEQGW
jgi:hypothetical protein